MFLFCRGAITGARLGDHSVMICLAAQAQHAAAATKLREMSPPVPAAMRWYRMPERVEREWRERVEREWRPR